MNMPAAQMAFPAAIAVAGSMSAGSSGTGESTAGSRHFGLTMRFAVTFTSGDDIKSLGRWSACKGLKVDFKTETVKQGGVYDHEYKLPAQVTYGPVTLERAIQQPSSGDLQSWLGKLADKWMNSAGLDGLTSPPEGTVTIDLKDLHNNTVCSWTLNHAFPVSWSGPALDAKGSTVAIETLTLEHQGFLPPTGA